MPLTPRLLFVIILGSWPASTILVAHNCKLENVYYNAFNFRTRFAQKTTKFIVLVFTYYLQNSHKNELSSLSERFIRLCLQWWNEIFVSILPALEALSNYYEYYVLVRHYGHSCYWKHFRNVSFSTSYFLVRPPQLELANARQIPLLEIRFSGIISSTFRIFIQQNIVGRSYSV